MIQFEWSEEKNNLLKKERSISFEDIEVAIVSGGLLDIVPHHNQKRYPGQMIFIVKTEEYIYQVPHVRNTGHIYLKTIIPNRKVKKKYE